MTGKGNACKSMPEPSELFPEQKAKRAEPLAPEQHLGMGETRATAIRIILPATRRVAWQPTAGSLQALINYPTNDTARLLAERNGVLFLNNQNMLINDEKAGDGTVDEAEIHPREVIRRAPDLGATAPIAVHNHPLDSPQPGGAHIQITSRIAQAGRMPGVVVRGHVILEREGHVSLEAKAPF
jgi:DNA repair protein RadC